MTYDFDAVWICSNKNIQNGFMLGRLSGLKEQNIMEIGGGNSRVLPVLAKHNECWNIGKFQGVGAGPTRIKMYRNIRYNALIAILSIRVRNNY